MAKIKELETDLRQEAQIKEDVQGKFKWAYF